MMVGLLLCVALSLALVACDSGKKEEGANGKPAAESSSNAPKAETAAPAQAAEEATPPPRPEELDRADRLVAFSNSASMALEPLSWQVEVMPGAGIPTSAVKPNLKNKASLVHSTFYGGTTCTLLR